MMPRMKNRSLLSPALIHFLFQANVDDEEDGVASDFDLNSLIEGDVDDDSTAGEDPETQVEESNTPVVRYYEPLKVNMKPGCLSECIAMEG